MNKLGENSKNHSIRHLWQGINIHPIIIILTLLVCSTSAFSRVVFAKVDNQTQSGFLLTGKLLDPQGQPIEEATITILDSGEEPLGETASQEDGSWITILSETPNHNFNIVIEHPHFEKQVIVMEGEKRKELEENRAYQIGTLTLEREIKAGFWVSTFIFLMVLVVIAFEFMHSTIAALLGFSLVFLVSYIGGAITPDLFIFNFERGLRYINWEVIFLVMGMMIIIAVIEGTGIFQWAAFQAYRLSRGRNWLLVIILMAITALASALLDNFTTMLVMAPISLQIGFALGINPLALIIPEVMASNVGGISTLIGTPTNILIGAFAGIGFSDFLINQTAGVVIAMAAMAGYVIFHYREELTKTGAGLSTNLYKKLEENARVDKPEALWKAGFIFMVVLAGFILGEGVHMVPAVPAVAGAAVILIWLKPNVHEMIKAVDWTTLVFFMALFVVVGAIQEVGVLSIIAGGMSRLIGENLPLAMFVIVFGVGTLSIAIANIPLTASILPIVEFLSGSIPGATNKVLYYALSMGAAMGGNGFLIGGEANLVTAGITEQTETPISFSEFAKIGVPVTYLTLAIGYIWLLIRF